MEHREGKWFWGQIGKKALQRGKMGEGEDLGKGGGGGSFGGRSAAGIMREEGKKIKRVELKLSLEGSEWGGEEGRKRYEEALERLEGDVRGT